MSLTPAETDRLRTLLAALPITRQSPMLVTEMAAMLESSPVQPGQVIFDPGTASGLLYFLADGSISQTLGVSAQPWYQKDLVPGDFFGQRSLVTGQHETRAVATSAGTIFTMPAIAVSMLLDHAPGLREVLWHEGLASRLRGLPLFQSLSDNEIRWLAQLVEVVPAGAGAELPLDSRAGLWIVNWGQVEITGPAADLASGTPIPSGAEPTWVQTAGNFFFTLQQGAQFGGQCAARRARTVRNSELYFLDDRHFNRLLAALPAVRPLTDKPLDIPALLRNVPFFTAPGMTFAHRYHLAQYFSWEYVPVNQNISTQGMVGYSYVHLLRGAAMVTAVDDKGRARPVHMLQPGESYGQTSLLQSTRRDATVRSVQGRSATRQASPSGAEILTLDRRDLAVALAEHPELWHPGVPLFDKYRRLKEERPRYDWLDEGEDVLWNDRRHSLWLARPLVLLSLAFAALMLALSFLLRELGASGSAIGLANVFVLVLLYLPAVVYAIWDYRDDYYAVTNRRVTRHDREPFASDARIEAPLETVQDVTSKATLLGRLFDYGDVTVRTAAKVGSLMFSHVPHPDDVVKRIVAAKAGAAIATRGSTKEMLRQSLMSDLQLAVAVPDLDSRRALGENVSPQQVARTRWQRLIQPLNRRAKAPRALPVGVRRGQEFWRRLLAPLPERWRTVLIGPPPRPPRPLTGEVVWQKHWINLMQRGGAALASLVLLVAAALILVTGGGRALGSSVIQVILVWLLLFAVAASWFWYHLEDWRNDLYIVTDERIIDVEKKPLALSSTQRESGLDVIQTVDSKQNSVWARLLNYGDVVIRTAAADEGFTFKMVPSPMLVQKTIFQKVDAYRRRQDTKRIDERRRDVMEGLQVYHELNQGAPRRTP
ncbi:MAG TPA: cyclic nucleotide-binding domain-containing protein [Anaerolineae bacterium]